MVAAMPVPTVRGSDPSGSWFTPDDGRPPLPGDLIMMTLPDGAPTPPGWTRVTGGCYRYADGTERGFPWPAAWFAGVEPASDAGTTCKPEVVASTDPVTMVGIPTASYVITDEPDDER